MDIPQELKEAIDRISTQTNSTKIIEESQKISKRYRENEGKGKKLVTQNSEAIAYAISRMPATYSAVYSALSTVLKNSNEKIETVLDVGAGTGAATWAVSNLTNSNQITCLEREKEMINIGKDLMKDCELLSNTSWKEFDALKDNIEQKYDLVMTSYMINELPEGTRKDVINKLWDATNKILLIIEPGTPEGFKHILQAREMLLEKGANILAPCTHQNECAIKDDWCSFYVRVARSGIHRQAKKGELGYEDEKFSYVAFSKSDVRVCNSRILRHPQINKGYVKVKLCTENGIEEKTFSKKDGELYKRIKKLDAGDSIENMD